MTQEPEKNGVEVHTSEGGCQMLLFYGPEGQAAVRDLIRGLAGNRPPIPVYGIFDRRPTLDEELAKLGPHPLQGKL